jgi:hypothetical protein
MRIHENLLSEEEIAILRSYWENNKEEVYVNGYQGDNIQDYRLDIKEQDPEFNIIRKIIKKDFPQYMQSNGSAKSNVFFWSALQRAVLPHLLHIDDCFVDDRPAYTYIISFDSYDKHKTLVWKRICQNGNKELLEVFKDWQKNIDNMTKLHSIEDIEHTPKMNDDYMMDYFDFEGEYVYKQGSGCLFNARKMHATSNWKKYGEYEYRELLQIHITIPDLLEF